MLNGSHPIGIVGAGAVGTVLAAHLERAGRKTMLVEPGPRHERIARDGLRVTGIADISRRPWRVARSLEALPDDERKQAKLWCICTKAWSIPEILPALQHLLAPGTSVLSVQNGLGAEDMLAEALGPARVACAAVNFAAGLAGDGSAVQLVWFNPPNYVGVCQGDPHVARDVATLLTGAGLRTELVSNREIRQRLFHKTVLNVGLNALCAVTGVTMQQAMAMPHTRSLARALMQEALQVGRALGHPYGDEALDDAMAYLHRGRDHRPSMAVDLARGHPTEIELINGKIVELGARFPDLSVAANWWVTAMVVTEEIKNGSRSAERIPAYLGSYPT